MTSFSRLDQAVDELRRPISPRPDFEGRLVGRIRRAVLRRRILQGSAALAALLVLGYLTLRRQQPATVEFAIELPRAQSVNLVGDFNDWDRASTPLARVAGTDRWRAQLRLPRGLYHYAYLVDGAQWIVDAAAPDSGDADFGTAVSVLPVEEAR